MTNKKICVPVQRLVLILPVEQRDPDLFRGGQAGDFPAPLDEVGHVGHVVTKTGMFVYSAAGLPVGADEEGGGHESQQGGEGVDQLGKAALHGQGQHEECGQAGHQVEEDVAQLGKAAEHGHGQHEDCGDQVEEVVGVPGGLRKGLAGHVKSCQILKSRNDYQDFEKNIYLYHALKFDWREVDEKIVDDEELNNEEN